LGIFGSKHYFAKKRKAKIVESQTVLEEIGRRARMKRGGGGINYFVGGSHSKNKTEVPKSSDHAKAWERAEREEIELKKPSFHKTAALMFLGKWRFSKERKRTFKGERGVAEGNAS